MDDNSLVYHFSPILQALWRKKPPWGDSYGYRIIKDLSGSVALSESTLYPILRRLEQGGALSSYSVEHNGRLRKFYHLTPQGRRQLQDFLDSREELDRIFDFMQGSVANDEA